MKTILIVFHSQYKGNTKAMAELVAQGCRQVSGVEVRLVNAFNARVDMNLVEQADGLALGTPDYFSYVAGGLKQFFDDLCIADWDGKKVKGKPYVGFCTHGGGAKAGKSLEQLAKAMELKPVAKVLLCEEAPTGEAAEAAIALGKTLAQHVTAA